MATAHQPAPVDTFEQYIIDRLQSYAVYVFLHPERYPDCSSHDCCQPPEEDYSEERRGYGDWHTPEGWKR